MIILNGLFVSYSGCYIDVFKTALLYLFSFPRRHQLTLDTVFLLMSSYNGIHVHCRGEIVCIHVMDKNAEKFPACETLSFFGYWEVFLFPSILEGHMLQHF